MGTLEDKYFHTGWNHVTCTRDGRFRHNGKNIAVRIKRGIPVVRVYDKAKGGRKEKYAKYLVAMAWHPDYMEGRKVYLKDKDEKNIHIDNIYLSDNEFIRDENTRTYIDVEKEPIGEFYDTDFLDIQCTRNGVFRKADGTPIRVYYPIDKKGIKFSPYIKVVKNGIQYYSNASYLILKTFSPNKPIDDFSIGYIDGNTHNIEHYNLKLVKYTQRLEVHAMTFDEAYKSIKAYAEESKLMLEYMETGIFSNINKYMEKILIPDLALYIKKKYPSFSEQKIMYLITESLSFLYEKIDANRPVYGFSRFMKANILFFLKNGTWGKLAKYRPIKIIRNVELLNFDCLCKKFRESKIQ